MTSLIDELRAHERVGSQDLCRRAANEIELLNRLCKKQEATLQRYEDEFVNVDDEVWEQP